MNKINRKWLARGKAVLVETIRESKLVFGGAFGRGSAVRSSLLYSVLPYVTVGNTILGGD